MADHREPDNVRTRKLHALKEKRQLRRVKVGVIRGFRGLAISSSEKIYVPT